MRFSLPDNQYTRLLKNTGIVFLGNVGSKMLSFLMLPFYTVWMSPADYGQADLVVAYAALFLGPVFCCVVDAIFIFPAHRPPAEQRLYFSNGLFFGGGTFIVALLAGGGLYWILPADYFIRRYMVFIIALLGVQFLQSYFQQFCRAIGKIKLFVLSGFVLSLFVCVLGFVMVPSGKINGFLLAMILANLLTVCCTFWWGGLWRYFCLPSDLKNFLAPMLHYSIPLIPNVLMWWLVFSLNKPLLENYCGSTELGVFSFSARIANLLGISGQIFATAWQIAVFDEFGKKGYAAFYNRSLFALLLIQGAGVIIMSVFCRSGLTLLVNERYWDSWKYIPLLALGALLAWHAGYVGTNFQVTKRSKLYLITSLFGAAINIGGNLLLIPRWGAWGAVAAILTGNFVILASRVWYSEKIVRMTCLKPSVLFLLSVSAVIGIDFLAIPEIWRWMLRGIVLMLIAAMFRHSLVRLMDLKSILVKNKKAID